jgi:hypothetical protein
LSSRELLEKLATPRGEREREREREREEKGALAKERERVEGERANNGDCCPRLGSAPRPPFVEQRPAASREREKKTPAPFLPLSNIRDRRRHLAFFVEPTTRLRHGT